MVWIHGGGLATGRSDAYDPSSLVRDGVVVVTVNYRLGLFGFLAHPALAGRPGLWSESRLCRTAIGVRA